MLNGPEVSQTDSSSLISSEKETEGTLTLGSLPASQENLDLICRALCRQLPIE